MKPAYLKKDVQERYNGKRAWFVNAWRIIDEKGNDLIQPWCYTKTEARNLAKKLGYNLIEK